MAFFPLDTFASNAHNLSGAFEFQEFIKQELYLFHIPNLFKSVSVDLAPLYRSILVQVSPERNELKPGGSIRQISL